MASLITVPAEIRLQIYGEINGEQDNDYRPDIHDHTYCGIAPKGGYVRRVKYSNHLTVCGLVLFHPQILRVCRTITTEAYDHYFNEHSWEIQVYREHPNKHPVISLDTMQSLLHSSFWPFIRMLTITFQSDAAMEAFTPVMSDWVKGAHQDIHRIFMILRAAPRLRQIEITWNNYRKTQKWRIDRYLLRSLARSPEMYRRKPDSEPGYEGLPSSWSSDGASAADLGKALEVAAAWTAPVGFVDQEHPALASLTPAPIS